MISLKDLIFEWKPWAVVATAARGSTKKGQILSKHKSKANADKDAYRHETEAGIPAKVKSAPGSVVGDVLSEAKDDDHCPACHKSGCRKNLERKRVNGKDKWVHRENSGQ